MGISDKPWEDLITLNSNVEGSFDVIGIPAEFRPHHLPASDYGVDIEQALSLDTYQLPSTKDREGYHGDKHFQYWLSGLDERRKLVEAARQCDTTIRSLLDLGCASGRVIRHFAALDPDVETYGCDINRRHVEFCNRYLPSSLTVFQNHSIPSLPLADASLDLVTAFSVFTHIEAMETAWLMELRRILRPGGLAWVTVVSEKKLLTAGDEPHLRGITKHPKFAKFKAAGGMLDDRMVLRWMGDSSYSSTTVYRREYILDRWSRIMPIRQYIETGLMQDVVLFQT